MREIPIQKLNAQSFTLVLGDHTYRIRIYAVSDSVMCADVSIDSVMRIQGIRCLHGEFLIPWPSMMQDNGNFMFYSDDEVGYFVRFGDTCFLTYFDQSEMVDTSNG